MVEIVELQEFQRKSTVRRNLTTSAEVVIFPGVRIERQTFSLADRLSKPKDIVHRSTATGRVAKSDD